MQRVHAKAAFKLGDFPNDAAPLVADLAADGSINPPAVRPTANGPINAQNASRPQRSFAEIKDRFDGDTDARQDCGH